MSTTPDLRCRTVDLTARMSFLTVGPISLNVERGGAVGIMGQSGSGKSTLLRMLALFITPDSGELQTAHTNWSFGATPRITTEALVAHRRRMVYVSQENTLWPHLTIRENIALGPQRVLKLTAAVSRQRADGLLEALDLRMVGASRTWTVSGGEARRVAVARALALEPDVILLDEPETGLDPVRAVRQMDLILATCARAGTGAVIVSHNPATILRATTVTYVLHEGAVVESGPTQRVLEYPSHSATRALLAASGAAIIGPTVSTDSNLRFNQGTL